MNDRIEPADESPEGPLEAHPLTAARLANLDEWKATGVDPYPASFDRTALASELHDRYSDLESAQLTEDEAAVAGRVMLARSFGKLIFLTVEDTSGRIQVFCDKAVLGDHGFEAASRFEVGDWLGVSGLVMTTKKGELSVRAESMTLLAKGLRPLPDKWHGLADLETRSRRRYLDLIVNPASRAVAVTRSKVIGALRREFEARGFIEVETPVLLPEAGGALARPFMTHHNALGIDMYMRIATELHLKRLVVGGLERVFEIGRIFRNEGVDSTHNPEFTMLESYQALADYNDVMEMVEEVIPAVAREALGTDRVTYRARQLDLAGPYRRASFSELVSEAVGEEVDVAAGVDHLREVAIRHGVEPDDGWSAGKIIDHLFEAHVEDDLWDPVFVMDHPQDISPLAKPHRTKPGLTERFELFIAGAEYANAYSELNDPLEQRARFMEQAAAKAAGDHEAHPIDEDYLMALEYGMPPTGGLGIGVDRLVMLLTDQSHIRDVILFPTLRPEDS